MSAAVPNALMDRLSSCYFCGDALDASLSEYPVVPRSLDPDPDHQQQVVLCSTCRTKLATVVETVVDAAANERTADDDQATLMDESGIDPRPDPTAISDADETGLLDGDDDPLADSSPPRNGTGSGDESGRDRGTPSASPGDTGPTADDTGPDGGGSDDSHERDRDETTDADSGGGDDTDGPTLSRLEYSKVMRLVQNRDLPVPRNEIREVAVNAYDIDPAEFDTILNAAVERGLIGEENGRLVEP